MKYFVLLCGFGMAFSAHAADMDKAMKQFACNSQINQAAMDMGYGMDPDGVAFSIDNDGKTQVVDQSKIVSRSTKDGVEAITYKAKVATGFKDGKPVYETERKTIYIKRDSSGRVVSVNKDMNLKMQIMNRENFKKSDFGKNYKGAYPLMKGTESTFTYNGDSCEVNQNLYYEMKDENAKAEGKVTYDKAFCDKLKPMISKMGSQNASQCGNMITMAQSLHDQRNNELKKEGKTLSASGIYGGFGGGEATDAKTKQAATMNTFNIGAAVSLCATMNEAANGMSPWGMYGGGMYGGGAMMGSMMGMPSGGIMGGPSSATTNSKGKESSAQGTR